MGTTLKTCLNVKSESRGYKILFTGEIPCVLVLVVMYSRQKKIFEPRFKIILLDVDDYSNKINYTSKLKREMKDKVNE